MDFFKDTEVEIINMKEPIITTLYYMFLEKNDTDETLSLKLRFFFKYHYYAAHANNLQTYFNLLEMYPLTRNIITDYYNCIRKQLFLLFCKSSMSFYHSCLILTCILLCFVFHD